MLCVLLYMVFLECLMEAKISSLWLSFSFPEVLNTDEDILLSGPSGLAQGHSQRAEVSDSEYISRISPADKLFDRGNMVGVGGAGGKSGREVRQHVSQKLELRAYAPQCHKGPLLTRTVQGLYS